LGSICAALDVPLSEILSEVSDAVALEEAALDLTSTVEPVTISSKVRPAGPAAHRSGDVVAAA